MDLTLIITLIAFLVLVVIGAVLFKLTKQTTKNEKKEGRQTQNAANREQGVGRRAQMLRNRGARARRNEPDDAPAGTAGDEMEEEAPKDLDKLGAKKRAKIEAKAEKRVQREAEEQSRVERKRREEQAQDERRKQDEKEKALEKQREDEAHIAREEKERREQEEYLRMKEAFQVEAEGYDEFDDGEQENVLQEFVRFIKEQKVVVVEDLASRFKLKTQAAFDRIKDLQKDDILTGVIDDRGKFIYVSPEEMEAVAKFIRQRGRVSIQELAEHSNELIRLT